MIFISQELQNEYLFSAARPHLLKNKKDIPNYSSRRFCNQALWSHLFFRSHHSWKFHGNESLTKKLHAWYAGGILERLESANIVHMPQLQIWDKATTCFSLLSIAISFKRFKGNTVDLDFWYVNDINQEHNNWCSIPAICYNSGNITNMMCILRASLGNPKFLQTWKNMLSSKTEVHTSCAHSLVQKLEVVNSVLVVHHLLSFLSIKQSNISMNLLQVCRRFSSSFLVIRTFLSKSHDIWPNSPLRRHCVWWNQLMRREDFSKRFKGCSYDLPEYSVVFRWIRLHRHDSIYSTVSSGDRQGRIDRSLTFTGWFLLFLVSAKSSLKRLFNNLSFWHFSPSDDWRARIPFPRFEICRGREGKKPHSIGT